MFHYYEVLGLAGGIEYFSITFLEEVLLICPKYIYESPFTKNVQSLSNYSIIMLAATKLSPNPRISVLICPGQLWPIIPHGLTPPSNIMVDDNDEFVTFNLYPNIGFRP